MIQFVEVEQFWTVAHNLCQDRRYMYCVCSRMAKKMWLYRKKLQRDYFQLSIIICEKAKELLFPVLYFLKMVQGKAIPVSRKKEYKLQE